MNFKQYIQESLQANQIYKFYALDFILSSGNKQTFEDWELEEVRQEFTETKLKLRKDILADGMRACIRETKHVTISQLEKLDNTQKKGRIKKFSEQAEKFFDPSYNSLIDYEMTFDEVEKSSRNIFGMSLNDILDQCMEIFYDITWASSYGGPKWGDIARKVKQLLNNRSPSTSDIDSIIDLAHNTGSWLNKFPNFKQLDIALDDKFEARTPHQYKDKIKDTQVRKWLGKALIGMEQKQKTPLDKVRDFFRSKGRESKLPFITDKQKAKAAFDYARLELGDRWEEGEEILKLDPNIWSKYKTFCVTQFGCSKDEFEEYP